jgi:hypothetical protein
MNLITPIPEQQLLPLGATPISMATPAHDPANSATAYGNEILEYMSYHIRGSKVFCAEELPLDASPQEFAGLLWYLEHILRIGIDHARTLQHIQRQLQQDTPTTDSRSAYLAPAYSWLPKLPNTHTASTVVYAPTCPTNYPHLLRTPICSCPIQTKLTHHILRHHPPHSRHGATHTRNR